MPPSSSTRAALAPRSSARSLVIMVGSGALRSSITLSRSTTSSASRSRAQLDMRCGMLTARLFFAKSTPFCRRSGGTSFAFHRSHCRALVQTRVARWRLGALRTHVSVGVAMTVTKQGIEQRAAIAFFRRRWQLNFDVSRSIDAHIASGIEATFRRFTVRSVEEHRQESARARRDARKEKP